MIFLDEDPMLRVYICSLRQTMQWTLYLLVDQRACQSTLRGLRMFDPKDIHMLDLC